MKVTLYREDAAETLHIYSDKRVFAAGMNRNVSSATYNPTNVTDVDVTLNVKMSIQEAKSTQ